MTSSQAQPAQRQHWTRPRDFLWASLSYTLGLGTIWRLPFLFYKHGGAAFLLPYFACILLLGFPLLTAEVAVGQAFQSGSATAWALLKPFAGGLGPAMLTLAFIINIYYIVVIAWAGLYLLLSLGTWTSGLSLMAGRSCAYVWDNASCTENYQDAISNRSLKTSDEAFFRQRILGFEAGGNPEDYQPFLVVTLLLSWMFVFAILVKGSRSMRFGNLLTGVLPPVTMVILSLMAVFFLPGSFTGISDYLTPKLGALVTVAAWRDAATQVLFSYGVGLGALTALGSYSKAGSAKSGAKFSRHLKMLVGVHTLVGLTTVLGFYALAGHFQLVEGVPPLEKHLRTTGAIFVLVPRTLATLSNSHLWTSLFYGLVFFLGLGSQAMTVEGVVLAIEDALHFNTTRAFSFKKRVGMLSFMTLISFCLGLCLVKRKGLLTFDVFDSFGAPVWSLNNFLILECILFACFGLAAVEQRLPGLTFGPVTRSVLLYVTPTLLVLLQLFETFKFLDFIKSSLSSCKLGLGMSLLLAPYIVGLGIVVLYMVHRRVDDAKMTKDDLKKKMAFV